jgi:hypothetical protein
LCKSEHGEGRGNDRKIEENKKTTEEETRMGVKEKEGGKEKYTHDG